MKPRGTQYLFTFLLCLIASITDALAYTPVTHAELSNLCVHAIEQDSHGYIWIATANGLCKSFGKEYEIYFGETDDLTTIPSNSVTNLFTDSEGWLLVSTNVGACGLEKGTRLFHRFTPTEGYSEFCVYGFIEYMGRLFCYGYQGLYEISKTNKTLTLCITVPGAPATSAAIGPDGMLWLSNGVCLMSVNEKLQPVTRINFDVSDKVTAIAAIGDCLLLGTPHGLLSFNPKTQSINPTALGNDIEVRKMLAVDSTTVLVATGNQGLLSYDVAKDVLDKHYSHIDFNELRSLEINNVFCDDSHNVWVSTFDSGEVMLSANPPLFNSDREIVEAFRDDFITRTIFDSHNNLWVGTRSKGIGHYDGSGRASYFNRLTTQGLKDYSHDFVQDIMFDSKGRLWAGYNNSLIVCQPEYSSNGHPLGLSIIKRYPSFFSVVSMLEDSIGQIWIGTGDEGLFLIDHNLNTVKNISEPLIRSNNITKIISYDHDHILISAYSDGLYLIDVHNQVIRNFNVDNIQASSNTIDMIIDRDRNLWIGTYHHGLFRVDANTHEVKPCIDSQTYYDIVGLAQDRNGEIWASSSYGIYRFGYDGAMHNFYLKQSGLGGNQFHEKCVAVRPDGKILFGGNAGIEEIDPKLLSKATPTTIPILTKGLWLLPGNTPLLKDANADIANADIATVDKFKIKHTDNSFCIEFFGLDYENPYDIEYSYMLSGHDKDFIHSGNYNRATYSDLAPGNYDFYVKARYKGMEWQAPVKLMSIDVKPSPWLSIPAILAYVVLLFTLIIVLNRAYLRLRLIRQKYMLSEERIEQERQITANRIHFFTNISHELRTPLTLICGPVKLLRSNFKSMSESQVKESLDFIDNNIERLLTLINQLLSFRRVNGETLPLQVDHADLGAQLQSLTDLYNVYAAENSIKITFKQPADDTTHLTYDSDKVEKIIGNLIVNAIKYSKNNGNITMTLNILRHPEDFDKDFTYASISVADNGRGMAEDDIAKIFQPFRRLIGIKGEKRPEGYGIGLHFVAHLVKEHKGIIKTEKNSEGGMTFTVIFPVSDEAFSNSEFRNHSDEMPYVSSPDYQVAPESETVGDFELAEGRSKLLVVEDNSEVNTFISTLFADKYTVLQATNVQEALQIAAEECPDIIISDILMPGGKDGYDLCRLIKGDRATSHISLILLTAKTLDEDKEEGYKCGADAYICKPFSPKVLIACVNNLNAKRMQRASLILASAGLNDTQETPEQTQEISPLDRKFLEKLYAYIDANIENCELNVNMLGRELGFSRTNFYRKIKSLTGISPTDLLRVYRLNRAAELLLSREYTIGEVSEKVGFGSQSHFSSLFKKHFNVSPRTYVDQHFPKQGPIGNQQ